VIVLFVIPRHLIFMTAPAQFANLPFDQVLVIGGVGIVAG
jgi:hypothetical protein